MVKQEGVSAVIQHPSVKRFFTETSVHGLHSEDADRSANGSFNQCLFLPNVVLRVPRSPEERAKHTLSIRGEFAAIAPGIGFRLRSPVEQVALIGQAQRRGLMAPDVLETVGDATLMETVNGVTLDKYVQQDPIHINPQIIERVITHTTESHRKGIVIGDRWNANTMVTDDRRQIVELDHDIALKGDPQKTKAFELAQTLYHLVHFSSGHRDFMRDTVLDIYARNPQLLSTYNLLDVRLYLHAHTQYHYGNFQRDGILYEGFVPPNAEIDQLINGMEEIKNFHNKLVVAGATLDIRERSRL